MNKYIVLLRGINVSGKKLIKMKELQQHLLSIGFTNVKTYIQSGNIILETCLVDIKEIKSQINNLLQNIYGFTVEIFITDSNYIQKSLDNNPFLEYKNQNKVYLGFLVDIPNDEKLNILIIEYKTNKFGEELFKIIDNTLYFYLPNGQANSKFSNNYFEKKLGISITTRNINTCNKLIELHSL